MKQTKVPPAVRAVIALGGVTATAKAMGDGVTRRIVEGWMRSGNVQLGYLRRLAKLSRVSLQEFYEYEEAKVRRRSAD